MHFSRDPSFRSSFWPLGEAAERRATAKAKSHLSNVRIDRIRGALCGSRRSFKGKGVAARRALDLAVYPARAIYLPSFFGPSTD